MYDIKIFSSYDLENVIYCKTDKKNKLLFYLWEISFFNIQITEILTSIPFKQLEQITSVWWLLLFIMSVKSLLISISRKEIYILIPVLWNYTRCKPVTYVGWEEPAGWVKIHWHILKFNNKLSNLCFSCNANWSVVWTLKCRGTQTLWNSTKYIIME